jgi:hypothetical protein
MQFVSTLKLVRPVQGAVRLNVAVKPPFAVAPVEVRVSRLTIVNAMGELIAKKHEYT